MSFEAEAPIGRRKRIFALRIHPAAVSGFVFVIRAGGFDKPAFRSRGACPICPLSAQSTPVRLPPLTRPRYFSVYFQGGDLIAQTLRRFGMSVIQSEQFRHGRIVHASVYNLVIKLLWNVAGPPRLPWPRQPDEPFFIRGLTDEGAMGCYNELDSREAAFESVTDLLLPTDMEMNIDFIDENNPGEVHAPGPGVVDCRWESVIAGV